MLLEVGRKERKPILEIIAAASLSLAGISLALFGVYWNAHRIRAIIFMGICILFSDVAICAFWISKERVNRIVRFDQPTFAEDVNEAYISLGGLAAVFRLNEYPEGAPIKLFGSHAFGGSHWPSIDFRIEQGRLFVNAKIFGDDKRPTIELRDNKFIVYQPTWDRNMNNTALEVVNSNGKAVFQLIYQSPNRIRIYGLLCASDGTLMQVDADQIVMNPSAEESAAFSLKPIFKYPAWKYPGQYADEASNDLISNQDTTI